MDFQRKPDDPDNGPTEALKGVIELLDGLPREFSNRRAKTLCHGHFDGGIRNLGVIAAVSAKVRGSGAFCSTWNEGHAEKFVKTPLWVFHGEKDELIKPELGRRWSPRSGLLGGGRCIPN